MSVNMNSGTYSIGLRFEAIEQSLNKIADRVSKLEDIEHASMIIEARAEANKRLQDLDKIITELNIRFYSNESRLIKQKIQEAIFYLNKL